MPVPVPRFSRVPAHPVIKPNQQLGNEADQARSSALQQLTDTLPVSPSGPPPSFGTREEWINSLPSWRKLKPRRIWDEDARIGEGRGVQNFPEGLTGAANASVIKGTHAQACIPPLYTLLHNPSLAPISPQRGGEDADDEMSSDCSLMDQGQYDNESQWSASSPIAANADEEMEVADGSLYGVAEDERPGWHRDDGVVFEEPMYERAYERGAFSPIYEDDSPEMMRGPDASSSPIGPATPFGEYVDRAVATAETYTSLESLPAMVEHDSQYPPVGSFEDQYYQYEPTQEEAKEVVPGPEPVIALSSSTNYKKLAEPLAEWMASYVWKICTTGMSLPSEFAHPISDASSKYSSAPPTYLAGSIHSLFLSTLLQPSAILLALWYISRLPVYFGAVGLGPEHVKELRFRVELLGDMHGYIDREAAETNAPFRLVLLGCMLANKWLDDHTFSNKTWQTISNVPIESLNKLESLALDIFSHDLSTPPQAWTQWLTHLVAYHQSLSSPARPQPISRPSANPHSIIRKALEDILQAPVTDSPEPVFLGLEERKREKLGIDDSANDDTSVLEIDLDEDGPLREEYLPKRRVSNTSSVRSTRPHSISDAQIRADQIHDWENVKPLDVGKVLPPPAKWSPAADEPITRGRGRTSGQYVAVQPPLVTAHLALSLPPYQQDIRFQGWPVAPSYVPVNQHLATGVAYDPMPVRQQPLPAYTPYPYVVPNGQSHSRTQSLSCDHENCQSHSHFRSYSQSVFDYRCGDNHIPTNGHIPPGRSDAHWAVPGQYLPAASYRQPFGPHPNVNYQSSWLRT